MAVLALLPSPLLGGEVWEPVAGLLRESGRRAEAVHLDDRVPLSAREVLDDYLAVLPADEEYVLVPHSNAGLYLPALTRHRRVAGAVFVDAGLPPLGGGEAPVVPADFRPMLVRIADEQGMLPVWTQWWDEDEVRGLFPDPAVRAAVEQQQRRLPLTYFEDTIDVPQRWADRPCAYLSFGEGYASEAAEARRAGWPVQTLDGAHLEMLVHPGQVSEAIVMLLGEARRSRTPSTWWPPRSASPASPSTTT
jgi:hypothetical protein